MAKAKKRKKARTAKQKAATKKMLAARKHKSGGHKRKTAPKRKAAKRKTAKKTIHHKTGVPSMARRHHKRKSSEGGTSHRRRGRFRHGFGGGKAGGVMNIIKNTGVAIAGGLFAGVLANKLPLPDPRMKAAAPALAGLLLAMTIGRKNALAGQLAMGMLSIGGVSLIRTLAPGVPLLAGEDDDESANPELLGYNPIQELTYSGYGPDEDELEVSGKVDMSGRVRMGDDFIQYRSPADL